MTMKLDHPFYHEAEAEGLNPDRLQEYVVRRLEGLDPAEARRFTHRGDGLADWGRGPSSPAGEKPLHGTPADWGHREVDLASFTLDYRSDDEREAAWEAAERHERLLGALMTVGERRGAQGFQKGSQGYEGMTPACREALEAVYLGPEGPRSRRAAAAVLGISETALSNRLDRARSILRMVGE